ncbi:MAG TPA: SBBP repeat-containing protein [Bryobacteraceae bacterium]
MRHFASTWVPAVVLLVVPAVRAAFPIPSLGSVVLRDSSGALLVAGSTNIYFFPTTEGAYYRNFVSANCAPATSGVREMIPCYHGFISKISATGDQLIWSTLLGGSQEDEISGMALDSAGNIWVTGFTGSTDFPITNDAFQKQGLTFLAEISPDGARLLYSTYVGAPSDYYSGVVGVDQDDNVYITGETSSANFPATPGAYRQSPAPGVRELYVLKFDSRTRRLVYATVVAPISAGLLLGFDVGGTVHVAFGTDNSLSPPITPGAYSHPGKGTDIFVAALNATGSDLVFSTVIGGSGDEWPVDMKIDNQGNIYLTGTTYQTFDRPPLPPPDFPVTTNAIQAAFGPTFLMKLAPHASELLSSTFLGATPTRDDQLEPIQPLGLMLGSDNTVHLLLQSGRSDFPLSPDSSGPCFPQFFQGGNDHYVYARFSADLDQIEYSTALPRIQNDAFVYLPRPFLFDTSGVFYYPSDYSAPEYFFTIDTSPPASPGPTCLAESVTQSRFSSTPADTPKAGGPNLIVPGLLVSLYGPGIGPDTPARTTPDANGILPNEVSGIQVMFDGTPAPILSASSSRVDAVVPFSLAVGGTTTVSLVRDGVVMGSLTYLTGTSSGRFLSQNGTGYGPVAWNQDGTANSPDNPAKIGETLTFYATGAGVMMPLPQDGLVPSSPQSHLDLGTCGNNDSGCSHFQGMDCPIVYAGDAPGQVEGVVQFNCVLGPNNTSGISYPEPTLYYVWGPYSVLTIIPASPVYIQSAIPGARVGVSNVAPR